MSNKTHTKLKLFFVAALLFSLWWIYSAPPPHIRIAPALRFDPATTQVIAAVDRTADFVAEFEHLPSALPGHDDVVFMADGVTALASAVDGRIWRIDLRTQTAEPFADPPLMAAGMHEAPGDPERIYFCASRFFGQTSGADERVGLYSLNVKTRAITPVVLEVPATGIGAPVVYADEDARAPELRPGRTTASRPLAFCNDLEISEDGRRIYFTEPFSYAGAAMGGGTALEAVSLGGNGRIWRHDLDSGATRLVVEGFHFPDGILYDLHPGEARESSLIVSQTPMFRLTRFFLSGPKAGTAQTVIDGLTGMPDGLDRDRENRIWTGLLKQRSGLLTWLHSNAWIKPLFLRLPLHRVPQPHWTGVLGLSPDGATPLYFASYTGPQFSDIASVIHGPDGLYLTPIKTTQPGLVRLPYPNSLEK